MASSDWFKLMLSIPLKEPMTKGALFTQWSSIVCYNILGLFLIIAPQAWQSYFQLDFSGHAEGYFRLQAVAQLELGFLYVIFARSKFDVPGDVPIRGPMLSKILFVVSFMVPQYLTGSLPFVYARFYIVLDTLIAVTSFVIWYWETEDASVMKLAHNMMKFMSSGLPRRKSSLVVVICGAIQATVALVVVIKPFSIHNALAPDSFQGHAVGLFSAYFFLLVVHGTLSVTAGIADSVSFNMACVFYRLIIGVPSLLILAAAGQIEVPVAVFAASLDLVFAGLISVGLFLEGVEEVKSEGKKS